MHAFTIGIPKQSTFNTALYATEESSSSDDDSLIIGSEISNALQGLGSEAGYLGVAKKRNAEAKAQLMEQVRQEEEEAERKRQERENKGNEGNYGPGDLSSFQGFENDGYEESEGNDENGGWGEVKEDAPETEEEEVPKLFLFGDDDADTSGSGLILWWDDSRYPYSSEISVHWENHFNLKSTPNQAVFELEARPKHFEPVTTEGDCKLKHQLWAEWKKKTEFVQIASSI